jgi:hypothetical protein
VTKAEPLQAGARVHVKMFDTRTDRYVYIEGTIRGRRREVDAARPQWVAVELAQNLGDGNEYAEGDVLIRQPGELYPPEPVTGPSPYTAWHLRDLPQVRVDRYRIVPDENADSSKGA